MNLPSETPVLIIGAGPTGLSLALRLAASGVDFVLVDKLPAPQTTSRAAVVHARTLQTLEPLGVTQTLVAEGLKITAGMLRTPHKPLLRIPFADLHANYRYVLALPQNETEAILTQRLTALGGTIARGCEVTTLTQDPTGVTASLRHVDGTVTSIRTRYVAGTDGYHSIAREAAGIAFNPGTYPQTFILADVHMDWPLPADEMTGFLAPAGPLFVVPFANGRYRVIGVVEDAPPEPSISDVQSILDKRGPRGAQVRDIAWSSRFRVHHGLAATYRAGRILLAGDAAHVHSPAGGQGMNIGIQDAVSLGEHFTAAIREHAPQTHFDHYEAIRRPVAEKVVTMTDRMTRALTITSPLGRNLRNLALQVAGHIPGVQAKIAAQMAGVEA